ncbi:MAG: alpha/beta fold hydrolase [Pseudomonadota bacterium]
MPSFKTGFAAFGLAALAACSPSDEAISSECVTGLYGSPGDFVMVTEGSKGPRYGFSDGRVGTVSEDDSFQCRGEGGVEVDGTVLARMPIRVTPSAFESKGVTLAGQLLEPEDASPDTALVVFAHGSEDIGWLNSARDPYQMVGRGVSAFVYDKRGTGQSEGEYSQNFPELAEDLVAASETAKALADGRFGRFGLVGLSQGGWIAPLAAERAGADFLFIGYGLVADILEEDAAQVQLEMREGGYDSDAMAKAKQLTDVTARLAVSNYKDGLEDLDALRDAFKDEPWLGQIKGGFSGVILAMSTEELRTKGIPMFDWLNIDWSLKPMAVMREVAVPQFWALAEEDREAPTATTLGRLLTLREEGKDIAIRVFPGADHGMWEFEQAEDGSREYTKVTDGFHDLMADWAKDDLKPRYGASSVR